MKSPDQAVGGESPPEEKESLQTQGHKQKKPDRSKQLLVTVSCGDLQPKNVGGPREPRGPGRGLALSVSATLGLPNSHYNLLGFLLSVFEVGPTLHCSLITLLQHYR